MKFFETTNVEWWWRRDRSERFASHPWITFPGDPEDLGTPGIRQFLSTYPYVRETEGGLYVQANVRNNLGGIKQFDKTLEEITPAEDRSGSFYFRNRPGFVSFFTPTENVVTQSVKTREEVSPYHTGKRKIRIPE